MHRAFWLEGFRFRFRGSYSKGLRTSGHGFFFPDVSRGGLEEVFARNSSWIWESRFRVSRVSLHGPLGSLHLASSERVYLRLEL